MENMDFKNDHDILIMLMTEVKQVRVDIKELKDGTSNKIENHERRIEEVEKWKESNKIYISLGIFLLLTIVGMFIYHLTGFRI